ncbi:MAG: MFS transporter [Coxiellaceae bacterium]|nr:MFS transporter [Coxiellaceae bacterium]
MNKISDKSCKLAILAIALSSFAIGTTEFVTTGLLSNVANAFHVTIPTAGFVTSGYALGVVIGGPLLTALTMHLQRKLVLIGLMFLFIIGSVVSAIAPTFDILLLGRMLSAFSHGAFFGVGAVVVTSLVPAEKKASAIALMFSGLTLANVIGVPMGTLLGQHFGWRSAFWVISGLGLAGLIGILKFIPTQLNIAATHLKKELAAFKRPQLWLALIITIIGFSGLLTSFAYVEPMMTHVTGFTSHAVVWLLMIYGIGLVIGNIIGGKLADRALMPTILSMLTLLAITLFAFVFTAHYKILATITLFILGAVGFGTIPALQMLVMQKAEGAHTLASAANIAAFNTGVTIGVMLGGLAIHMGFGFTSPNWVGGTLTTVGLIIAAASCYYLKHKEKNGVKKKWGQVLTQQSN